MLYVNSALVPNTDVHSDVTVHNEFSSQDRLPLCQGQHLQAYTRFDIGNEHVQQPVI